MSKIIDGKAVSAQVKERIKAETAELKKQGIEVGLAVVIVGEDPASKVYVRNKKRACEEVGLIPTSLRCLRILQKSSCLNWFRS